MGIQNIQDQLDEAVRAYHRQKNRKLTQWKGETDNEYARRKRRHAQRVEHLDKLTDHLRRKLKAAKAAREDRRSDRADGLTKFDGVIVASWIARWLEKSRRAGWKGTVTSGYRTPEYSESLCINMCGAPKCPGTCGGRDSNHSGKEYPKGAVDVTDFVNFERIQYEIGSPLRNNLPYDPVHFSTTGY